MMRRRSALAWAAAGAVVMTASGCSASEPRHAMGGGARTGVCVVDGSATLTPAMANDAICARFIGALDAALAQVDRPVTLRNGWQFRLTFVNRGVATALLSHSDAAHVIDVNIAVSDRPLDGYAIDLLGRAAALRLVAAA